MFGEIRKENERLAQEKEQAQLPKLVKELQQMVVAQQEEIKEMR